MQSNLQLRTLRQLARRHPVGLQLRHRHRDPILRVVPLRLRVAAPAFAIIASQEALMCVVKPA